MHLVHRGQWQPSPFLMEPHVWCCVPVPQEPTKYRLADEGEGNYFWTSFSGSFWEDSQRRTVSQIAKQKKVLKVHIWLTGHFEMKCIISFQTLMTCHLNFIHISWPCSPSCSGWHSILSRFMSLWLFNFKSLETQKSSELGKKKLSGVWEEKINLNFAVCNFCLFPSLSLSLSGYTTQQVISLPLYLLYKLHWNCETAISHFNSHGGKLFRRIGSFDQCF